jgi:hypothetical protein
VQISQKSPPVPLARNLANTATMILKIIPFPLDTNLLLLAGSTFIMILKKAQFDLDCQRRFIAGIYYYGFLSVVSKMGTVRSCSLSAASSRGLNLLFLAFEQERAPGLQIL